MSPRRAEAEARGVRRGRRLPRAPDKEAVVLTSTLKRGFSPVVVALAGLVLALALLGPSAASAKPGGTDRRSRPRSRDQRHRRGERCVRRRRGRDLVPPREGHRPHAGVATPSGPGTVSISGTGVEVAANGDRLYVTLSASAALDAASTRGAPSWTPSPVAPGASSTRAAPRWARSPWRRARSTGDADVGHRPLADGHRQLLTPEPAPRRVRGGALREPPPSPS